MIDQQRVLAVIIGRAGSRGLPGKNALPLAGRPLICHTVDDALESDCIDRVLVSTNGEAIARAARSTDVEIIMRPAALASDTATVDDAVRHAVRESHDDAPIIVILYANVPLRPAGLIDRAVRALVNTGADSVQSYCGVGKHHPFWMMSLDDEGRVAPYIPNDVFRRQDLPPLHIPDGGVIAVRRESLFRIDRTHPHAFLGERRHGVTTSPGEVIDIDTHADLLVARTMIETPRTALVSE